MEITIIGTGNMARGIATRATESGDSVTLLGTDEGNAKELAQELSGEVGTGTVGDPLAGDVVIPAVWFDAVGDIVERYVDELAGKILVDITNPIDVDKFEPLELDAGSGAEETAKAAPKARVVKAFNTTFAATLGPGKVDDQALDVLIASDDDDAKGTVASMVENWGLRPIDAGPLRRARQIEGLGYLHMAIQDSLGTSYGSAAKFIG